MRAAVFDTLSHCKKLRAAGFTEQQAEVQAEAIAEIIDEKLATKKDLVVLEESLKRDMQISESNLKRDMNELEANLRRDMHELEQKLSYKLTLRMGSMSVAMVSILAILIKLH